MVEMDTLFSFDFLFQSLDFTLFTFGISELSNECGKCVVIEYISPGPFITSKPLI